MPVPRALGSLPAGALAALGAALLSCAPTRAPLGPSWSVAPSVPAEARSLEVVLWEGSCWGSSGSLQRITVGDELVVVRTEDDLRVEPRAAWESKRLRLNELLRRTRPREIGTREAPRFDPCKAGANYDCGLIVSVDGAAPVQACCGPAGMTLAGFVRAL